MSANRKSDGWTLLNLRARFDADRFAEWTALYDRTFAAGETHEDASQWRDWYAADDVAWDQAKSRGRVPLVTLLAVEGREGDGGVLGGINIELYRRSGCALITYIAVAPEARQRGIGKRLVEAACESARVLAESLGGTLKAVLFETYQPVSTASESRATRVERLFVLDRLGGRKIVFQEPGYCQPPLEPGQQPSRDLYLCHFPQYLHGHALHADTLRTFFAEFAFALTGQPGVAGTIGVPEVVAPAEDPRGRAVVLDEPLLFLESRDLEIRQFAFALHLEEEEPNAPCGDGSDRSNGFAEDMPSSCPAFRTWEHDLTAHAYLDRKPFTSRCFELPHGVAGLEIVFPRQFDFSSEGRDETLFTLSRKEESRRFRLGVSRTRFRRSGGAIWHVVLRNWPNDPIYEFDLIKIIQLYEGYESDANHLNQFTYYLLDGAGGRMRGLPGLPDSGSCAGFETLVQVLERLIEPARLAEDGIAPPLGARPCGGTIQILAPDGPLRGIFGDIIRLSRDARPGADDSAAKAELEELFETSEPMRRALLATCGIVQGIFDFNEIDPSEVADILDPTLPELACLHRIHRSTYTCIQETDRAFDACESTIHISPYLILPHSVLLHDELLLRRSSRCITGAIERLAEHASACQPGMRSECLTAAKEEVRRAGILLDRLPQPNPFNYFTEREFLRRAIDNHGFDPRLQGERTRLLEVSSQLRAIEDLRRARDRSRLFLLLSLLAIISAGEFMSQAVQALVTAVGDRESDAFGESIVTVLVTIIIAVLAGVFLYLHRRAPGGDGDD